VPNYQGPCWYTLDPASLLITSHFNEHMPVLAPEALALEYYEDDVNKLADVARSPSGLSTLHEATGGDPLEPAVAREHRAGRRSGADRRPADRLRRGVGRTRALP
jgi:hypothetical protein